MDRYRHVPLGAIIVVPLAGSQEVPRSTGILSTVTRCWRLRHLSLDPHPGRNEAHISHIVQPRETTSIIMLPEAIRSSAKLWPAPCLRLMGDRKLGFLLGGYHVLRTSWRRQRGSEVGVYQS
jgi:hypothetical protein